MKRVVIDNSVILDALLPDARFELEARELLRMASAKEIEAFVSANSLTDIFYVLRKRHGAETAKEIIRHLTKLCDIIGILPEDCISALEKPMDDFEDALVAVCAEKASADCIITRDERFLKLNSTVKTISPPDFLATLK